MACQSKRSGEAEKRSLQGLSRVRAPVATSTSSSNGQHVAAGAVAAAVAVGTAGIVAMVVRGAVMTGASTGRTSDPDGQVEIAVAGGIESRRPQKNKGVVAQRWSRRSTALMNTVADRHKNRPYIDDMT